MISEAVFVKYLVIQPQTLGYHAHMKRDQLKKVKLSLGLIKHYAMKT
jgi:hypothetical protein